MAKHEFLICKKQVSMQNYLKPKQECYSYLVMSIRNKNKITMSKVKDCTILYIESLH